MPDGWIKVLKLYLISLIFGKGALGLLKTFETVAPDARAK